MKRMFGFLIGVVVGGLVGSTIALLLAPESGEVLRTQLRSRGEGFFNEVRHAADERKIELRQKLTERRLKCVGWSNRAGVLDIFLSLHDRNRVIECLQIIN